MGKKLYNRFITFSKVQVYGNIDSTYLQENSDVMTQLGIYICTPLIEEVGTRPRLHNKLSLST